MALLRFKRSAVPAKVPTLADLSLGELAINTFDGKIYIRRDNGTASIVEVGGGSGVLSFNTRTGAVTLTSGDVTGALGYTPANRAGDTFTGPVSATSITSGLGAVGTPSYTFTGDTNTGMWSPAADTLAFSTAGSERLRVDSVGNVGIGTASPSALLTISRNGGGDIGALVSQTNSGNGTTGRYRATHGSGAAVNVEAGNGYVAVNATSASPLLLNTNNTERMRLDASGNVGIGTSSPGVRVDIVGPALTAGTQNTYALWVANSGGANGDLAFGSNASTALIQSWGGKPLALNSQGNGVLIGTTTAGRTVCINSADNWIRQSNPARSWLIGMGNQSNYLIWDETGGGPRLTVGTGGEVIASGDFRAPIFYDSNNTGFYVDPAGTSLINALTVGSGQASSSISMGDTDEGGRLIHCNSNRIGFLTQGGSWGSYCSDDGAWLSDVAMYSPIYYDSQDTAFYVDPNNSSRIRNLNLGGGSGFDATIHVVGVQGGNGRLTQMSPSGASQGALNIMASRNASNGDQWFTWGVNTDNSWYINPGVGFNGAAGIRVDGGGLFIGRNGIGSNVNTMNDTGSFSVRGDPNNAAVISFHRTAAYGMNMGLGTDAVFRIGGFSAQSNLLQVYPSGAVQALNDFRAPIFYNSNDTTVRWSQNDFVLRGSAPTIYFRDTDANSAMIHCNSNLLYVLRGGNDTEGWSTVNGHWPLVINLTNNDMTVGGNFTAVGNVTAFSDIRVKENVEQISGALDRLHSIRGVTYTRNDLDDKERRYAGVIAQEIEAVLPEAVFESGNKKAVDYNATIGLLIEAIKELTARVAELEGK